MTAETAIRPPPAFSLRAFGLGVAGVLGVGALAIVYLWLNGAETMAAREKKLASQTVMIQYEEEPILSGAEPQPEIFGPFLPDSAMTDPVTVTENPSPSPIEDPATPIDESVAKTETGEADSLARAPIDGLYEDTRDGRLPKIRSQDKLTPFQAYRRPFTNTTGKPVISVAIIGLGISDTATRDAIEIFPAAVTLVMDPYSTNPDFWVNEARSDGHEVWLKLPVETSLYPLHDPGPQTLMMNGLERQNQNKLNWVLSRATGYSGVVTGYDAAFTNAANALQPVLDTLYMRGLGFIDGNTQPSGATETMTESMNTPYAHNQVWIDMPSTNEHAAASLRQLEVLAQSQGSAIGFIHATPMSMNVLSNWIKGLEAKGFVLAPLSAQADPKK